MIITAQNLPENTEALNQRQQDYLTSIYKSPMARLSVGELLAQFSRNAVVAEDTYLHQVIIVSGEVQRIDIDAAGIPVVSLTDRQAGPGYAYVECIGVPRATARQLKQNMPVQVEGIVSSAIGGASLKLCDFLNQP